MGTQEVARCHASVCVACCKAICKVPEGRAVLAHQHHGRAAVERRLTCSHTDRRAADAQPAHANRERKVHDEWRVLEWRGLQRWVHSSCCTAYNVTPVINITPVALTDDQRHRHSVTALSGTVEYCRILSGTTGYERVEGSYGALNNFVPTFSLPRPLLEKHMAHTLHLRCFLVHVASSLFFLLHVA